MDLLWKLREQPNLEAVRFGWDLKITICMTRVFGMDLRRHTSLCKLKFQATIIEFVTIGWHPVTNDVAGG